MSTSSRGPRRHAWLAAVGLFLLAPFVGEFLLGNQPITALPEGLQLAPMYGGGALLIREITRRTGRGWPTIVLLALAYGLLEEGPIDQMLFNPAYLGLDSFAGQAYVPGLGISATLTQATVTLHTIWSICVPIALVEALGPDRTRPWLGRRGLIVVAVVFVAGSAWLTVLQAVGFGFVAPAGQLIGSAVVIVGLVVLAFRIGRRPVRLSRPSRPTLDTAAPRPWLVGLAAFALTSVYWAEDAFLPDGLVSEWAPVAWWFVLVGIGVAACLRWARRRDWGGQHVLALAGGALLTYVWAGFVHGSALDEPDGLVLLGNVVFGLVAIAVLVLAIRAERRRAPASP